MTLSPAGSPGPPVVRTPDACFHDLAGYPFEPNYLEIRDPDLGALRVHYVDEGPRDAPPVLLVHGQPTWSYLYRTVIRDLAAAGHRVVAPDNVGYGRSDKPTDRFSYTFERHVAWHRAFVEALGLTGVTVVGQDWGGPIGFGALATMPHRYQRIVAANTILHCADPSFAGRLAWANHGLGERRVVLEERLVDYIVTSQRNSDVDVRAAVARAVREPLTAAELDAYAAPFPDERHLAGVRQMTTLIPVSRNDPGSLINRRTWDVLGHWTRPFLTAFSDGDEATRGFDSLFRERVPGAAGMPHTTIRGAAHFVQEDRGHELARVIADLVAATPP